MGQHGEIAAQLYRLLYEETMNKCNMGSLCMLIVFTGAAICSEVSDQTNIIDFRDYWPFGVGTKWKEIPPNISEYGGTSLEVIKQIRVHDIDLWHLRETTYSWRSGLGYKNRYYFYLENILYSCPTISDVNCLPDLPSESRYEFPEVIEAGSKVTFRNERQVIAAQGTLLDVLAMSTFSIYVTADFPWGNTTDVLAFLDVSTSGVEPILIFGRDTGPILFTGIENNRFRLPYCGNTGLSHISVSEPLQTDKDFNDITLIAEVNDPDSEIAMMEFYVDQKCVGQDSNGIDGWQFSWHDPIFGDHYLYARGVGDHNAVSYSNGIDFYVYAPPGYDVLPSVSLVEPNHLSRSSSGMPTQITASILDSRWKIIECIFEIVGKDGYYSFKDREAADGWSVMWENPPDGSYLIEAKATFHRNWTTRSEVIGIVVGDGEFGNPRPGGTRR